jgi:heme-degrading monooxygenase HmoA
MVLEQAELTAKEGVKEEFLAVLRGKGSELLRKIPGCLGVRVGGGVESPDKVLLLVDWESLEAHEAFRTMPEAKELGGMLGPFAAGGKAEHFELD